MPSPDLIRDLNKVFGTNYVQAIRFKRLHPAAELPQRASEYAACLDLKSVEDAWLSEEYPSTVIGTGLAVDIPHGYVGLVCSRSGMAAKDQRFVLNAPGVIDSDYRGEIKVILGCLPRNAYWPNAEKQLIPAGTRVAQLMIMPLPHFTILEVEELSETLRGDGHFGSTGA